MSSKREARQGRAPPPDSDDEDELNGFVGVGDGSKRRRGRGDLRPHPFRFDDDDHDDGDDLAQDSDSDQEIDRRVRAKKRAQFERGIGNEEVEGEQVNTSAPDGFEPFHMKEERARGWFDSAGNFNLEAEDVREAWLRDYDQKQEEMKDSFVPVEPVDLSRRGIKRYRPNRAEPADEYEDIVDQTRERHALLKYLKGDETVLDALRRLGKGGDEDKAAFMALTESADRLLQSGHYDVYQDTISSVEAALRPSKPTSSSAHPELSSSSSGTLWEMRWSNDDTDSEPIHGPYSAQQMDEWKEQGMFAAAGRTCYVRVKGAADPEWTDVCEIDSFVNY